MLYLLEVHYPDVLGSAGQSLVNEKCTEWVPCFPQMGTNMGAVRKECGKGIRGWQLLLVIAPRTATPTLVCCNTIAFGLLEH